MFCLVHPLPADTPVPPWTAGPPLWERGCRATPRGVGRRSPHKPQPLAFPGPTGRVATKRRDSPGPQCLSRLGPLLPSTPLSTHTQSTGGCEQGLRGSFPTRFRQTLSSFLKYLWLSKLNTSFAWRLPFPSGPLSLGWVGGPGELPGASALGTHLSHVWAGAELTTGAKWSPARPSETPAPLGAYLAHGLG